MKVSKISAEQQEALTNLCNRESLQTLMKATNKIIKKHKGVDTCKPELLALGHSETKVYELLNPKFTYQGQGYPAYALTNNNANISRLRQRVTELEKKETKREEIANNEQEQPEQVINGVTIKYDYEADRVQLYFDGKPAYEIIQELKNNGWRWAPSIGAWSRKLTPQAQYDAKRICRNIGRPAWEQEIISIIETVCICSPEEAKEMFEGEQWKIQGYWFDEFTAAHVANLIAEKNKVV